MSQTNNGGPAFPNVPTEVSDQCTSWDMGMSLRDYFAARASESDIANHAYKLYHDGGCVKDPTREQCRYAYADAMLAERQKERE